MLVLAIVERELLARESAPRPAACTGTGGAPDQAALGGTGGEAVLSKLLIPP